MHRLLLAQASAQADLEWPADLGMYACVQGMKTTYELFAQIMHEQLQQHQQGSQAASGSLPSLKLDRLRQASPQSTAISHSSAGNSLSVHDPSNRTLLALQLLGVLGLLFLLLRAVLGGAPCPIHWDKQGPASALSETLRCLLSHTAGALPDMSWHWHRAL